MRVILIGDDGARGRLRQRANESGVTVAGEYATVADARASGVEADAYLTETDPPRARRLRVEDVVEALTPREIEVLQLLADGLPNKVIAARLHISDQTVKFHVAAILGKLGVANRTEAVRVAVRRGLIAM